MRLARTSQLFGRPIYWLSSLALLLSFVLPIHGLGPPACGILIATHRPCFGCGMTRAITCISQGRFDLAWHYHPFAFLIWPAMLGFTLAALCPPFRRRLEERWLKRHDGPLTVVFWALVGLFVLYGFGRMIFDPTWPA
ncbi:MAG: DUF2752 domain-containing protein [Planctomycetes bacterium]|nr:DUF2752 domain-containing protein [Planctomycetota bacterium]